MSIGNTLSHLVSSTQRIGNKIFNRVVNITGLASSLATATSSRWYLILEIMPQVIFCIVARFLICDLFNFPGLFPADTVSNFSNSAIFVVAIMLAGVLEDYKESEGFPATIASHFDAICNKFDLAELLTDIDVRFFFVA